MILRLLPQRVDEYDTYKTAAHGQHLQHAEGWFGNGVPGQEAHSRQQQHAAEDDDGWDGQLITPSLIAVLLAD